MKLNRVRNKTKLRYPHMHAIAWSSVVHMSIQTQVMRRSLVNTTQVAMTVSTPVVADWLAHLL